MEAQKNIMNQPDIINREGQNGFTLIEIIIAMFVFVIGALGVATMQISSIHGNIKGRSITEASVMGTNVYEELFTLPYNHALLLDVDGNGTAGLNDGVDGGPGVPDGTMVQGRHTISWNVAQNEFMDDCKTVAVHIRWRDRGADRTITLRHVVPRLY
jgi:type IV pilus assembly protein PilV